MDENEAYAEAQRRIKACREKKNQKLDLSSLIRLRAIPPEIAELDVKYDPISRNEDSFRQNILFRRDLNWNIHGFGEIPIADEYICCALYILHKFNNWPFEDIAKINCISSEIKVICNQ